MRIEPGSGEYVEADGLRTYFVRRGNGPAVILLHGQPPGGSVHVIWGPTIDYFADRGFSVYAFDSVGFGRTDSDPDVTRERRVRHAIAFIDAMGLARFSLWGMSDGSNLSCRIALRDKRADKLVLMASGSLSPRPPGTSAEQERLEAEERANYEPSLENARAYLNQALHNPAAITDELIAEMHAMSTGQNAEDYRRRMTQPRQPPIYNDLDQLSNPVLMLWGRQDNSGPIRGLLLQEKIPGAELHIFDNCGHWVNVDQPDRVNSIVYDFLSGK